MTESSSERALLAILALEPEEGVALDKEAQAFGKWPLPTLDARVEKYMRAMSDGDFGAEDPAKARELILAAMAKDLANGSERKGEGGGPALFATLTQPFQPGSQAFSLRFSCFDFCMVPSRRSADRRLFRLGGGTSDGRLERRMGLYPAFTQHHRRRMAGMGGQFRTPI